MYTLKKRISDLYEMSKEDIFVNDPEWMSQVQQLRDKACYLDVMADKYPWEFILSLNHEEATAILEAACYALNVHRETVEDDLDSDLEDLSIKMTAYLNKETW